MSEQTEDTVKLRRPPRRGVSHSSSRGSVNNNTSSESFGHKLRKRLSSDAFFEAGKQATDAVKSAAAHQRTSSLTMIAGTTAGLSGTMPDEAEYGTFSSPLDTTSTSATRGAGGKRFEKKDDDVLSLPSSDDESGAPLRREHTKEPMAPSSSTTAASPPGPVPAAATLTTSQATEEEYVRMEMSLFSEILESRKFVKDLYKIAMPITISNFMRNLSMVFTVFFVGHFLPREEFAGVAMGLTFANLTAISVGIGFSSALDTLCSQEFGKNPKSTVLGTYLQRAIVSTLAMYIPVTIFYLLYAEKFLALMIPEGTAYWAAKWLKYSPPTSIPMVLSSCVQKFAQSQGEANVTYKASLVGMLMTPILLFLAKPYGFVGFALALAASRWCSFTTVCYLVYRIPKLRDNFGSWNSACLHWHPMKHYLSVGFPSALAFCADFWGFEAMAVVSGHLGDVQVAAWMIMMNIYTPMFGPCIGVSSATCVKVGNELGASHPNRARLMSLAGLLVASALAVAGSAIIFFLGPFFYQGLTSDEVVVRKGRSILIVAQLTYFLDVFFFVFQGIFRGCGKQSISAIVLCTCLWGIGVPGAYILAVKEHFDLIGVSIGLTTGIAVVIPILFWYYASKFDWESFARAASLKKKPKAAVSGDQDNDKHITNNNSNSSNTPPPPQSAADERTPFLQNRKK